MTFDIAFNIFNIFVDRSAGSSKIFPEAQIVTKEKHYDCI